jgi:hypothetical protein
MMKTQGLFIVAVCLILASIASAQELQSGSIRGRVVDDTGQALPGVSITISGPALIGKVTAMTNAEGLFRAPNLTPGAGYEIKAEIEGFETTIQTGIIVNVGKTISIEMKMKVSTLRQEVTITAPSPTVDVVKSSTSKTVTSDVMTSLPLPRGVTGVRRLSPGAVGDSFYGDGTGEGGAVMDGIQMSEPDGGGFNLGGDTGMAWDMVDEVEIVGAGAAAQFYNSASGMTNVIMKSGGNKFSGEASVYYTNKDLSQIHLPVPDIQALALAMPSIPVYWVDTALAVGGPVIKDRLWFMGEFRYIEKKNTGDFRPTVINGKQYNNYDHRSTNYIGFLKFSAQLIKNIRASAMGHYSEQDFPYQTFGWSITDEANRHNRPIRFNYSGTVSWTVNSSTILDLRAGGLYFKWKGGTTPAGNPDSPVFTDAYTGYKWGNSAVAVASNVFTYKPKVDVALTATKFVDNFLGGNHEFKAGLEWERNRGEWGFYMTQPLFWTYYNGSPYYYRALNKGVTDPVYGDGQLRYAAIGTTEGSSSQLGLTSRIGGFIQDSFTIKRLTINLGLRADHLTAWSPGRTKGAATDPVALALGATYFQPIYGINPYDSISYATWDNAFPYGVFFSPRVGLTYDLFGGGRTALKASFSRQQEGFVTGNFSSMYPLAYRSFTWSWWDDNNNGIPDLPPVDRYKEALGATPLPMISTAYLDAIDPKTRMPYVDEITAAIEHELVKDVNVAVRYIHKDRKRILASVLWDKPTGRYWYSHDLAPEWWIPFKTTVPAYGSFPAQDVTMYFLSPNAPAQNRRLTNVPEGAYKYHCVEVSFDKRMANGWQLGGSVDFSKLTGNYSVTTGSNALYSGATASWTSVSAYSTPNSFVNAYGEMPYSRPILIRLYGSFRLPYQLMLSFFYMHTDGSPWARTVTVVPPAAWVAANKVTSASFSINVETPGTRRDEASDSLDLRLEKDFKLGPGTLGAYVDIFNLLGAYTLTIDKNPGGTWRPADENTTSGSYTPASLGLRGFTGSRQLTFSLFYRF